MDYETFMQIPYFDENGSKIDHFQTETREQKQAWEFVPEDATVLELGARYGTVSCIINFKLKDRKKQVSVEPDPIVLEALKKNRESHNGEFIIFDGVISHKNMKLHQDNYNGYGNFCMPCNETSLKTIPLKTLIEETGLKFDTLVADCEGFLEQFFDENIDYFQNFRIIMFERDYPYRCNYPKIEQYLVSIGFKLINQSGDMHVVYAK